MKRVFALILAMLIPLGARAKMVDFTHEVIYDRIVITGSHPDGDNKQVTFLAVKDGFSDLDLSKIVAIDQVPTGVNGGFMIQAGLGILDEPITLRVGGTDIDTVNEVRTMITTGPATIEDVTDNSILIGNDIYEMSSPFLTSKNAANSLGNGGYAVYFKLGGLWYDLLNPQADSAQYLVPKNAVPTETLSGLNLDKWYRTGGPVDVLTF